MSGENSLVIFTKAAKMLAEANTIQKTKELKDLALTAAEWARRKDMGEEAIQYARSYALDAERKMGQMLAEKPPQRHSGPGRGIKQTVPITARFSATPSLADLKVSEHESRRAQKLAELPEEKFQEIKSGKKTITKVVKEIKKENDEKQLKIAQEKVTAKAREKFNSVCDIRCCSMKELLTSGIKPDCIITDPPYPKKFLHLYEELAELSKSIPLVAVMCGQSYLPDIIAAMTKHLQYRWILAYLTPGGQAAQQWEAKINAYWKPVLLFGKAKDWIGDVCKSDANDKRFHEWGQSESGMADLIDRLSEPGQIVCDPFVGGGTTALVSLRLGRRFVGCDIDKGVCEKAVRRCEVDFKL
jgi:hypothetical protein